MNVINSGGGYGADFFIDVALGKITGFSSAAITGVNDAVGATSEDLSDQGGTLVPLVAASSSWNLVSASASDTAAGTGTQSVAITFLNSNWEEVVVFQATNGGSAAISGTYLRAVSIIGVQSGSNLFNVGNITVEENSNVHLQMSPANNSSFSGLYSVPAGKIARVVNVSTFVAKNDEIRFQPYLIQQNQNYISGQPTPLFEGSVNQRLLNPFPITQKQDIVFRAEALSAGSAQVSIIAEILLQDVPVTANP